MLEGDEQLLDVTGKQLLDVTGLEIEANIEGRTRTLVAGVDLSVRSGESVAIVGESGSGKSLTARAVLGLLPGGMRAEGTMTFRDETGKLGDADGLAGRLRGREIALVLQDPFTSLNPLMRCGLQVCEASALRDLPRAERREEAIRRLHEVGITAPGAVDRYPFQLSGGMRQRVALAAALATDPSVLIADEFSTALDVTTQKAVLELLRDIQRLRGMGLVLITHDLRMAFAMCDRIYVMYAGSFMELAEPDAIERRPRHPYTLSLLLSEPSLEGAVRSLSAASASVPRADEVRDRCAFESRCVWTRPACTAVKPPLVDFEHDGMTACIRIAEISTEMENVLFDVDAQPSLRETVATPLDSQLPLLEIRDLRKTFTTRRWSGKTEHVTALRGVSLTVHAGESVGIVGESGSGKTTLARCIVGLERLGGGRVTLAGTDVSNWGAVPKAMRTSLRQMVQYVFQDPYSSLNPMKSIGATLREAVAAHRETTRRGADRRVGELLDLVGLPGDYAVRKPVALSGGERQRVAIARALALEPKLILCDEPVSALDVSVQAQVLELLTDLRASLGISYLFISHDLAVVRQVADKVFVMLHGEIVESGTADQVLSRPSNPYTQQLVASIPGQWTAAQ